ADSHRGRGWLAVRDPATIGRGKGQRSEHDPGVADKRLLVHEPEFSSVLQVCARPGNTLSAIIRQGWDTGNLRVMTKNDPGLATGAHISVVGHIGKVELLRCLDATDQANGFANR